METEEGFKSALEHAAELNAAVEEMTRSGQTQLPLIEEPPDTVVKLPGGLLTANGEVIREAEVRELTGEHEEALVRVRRSGSFVKFVNMLLTCGVVTLGSEAATAKTLTRLLLGDRDALILGIRRATLRRRDRAWRGDLSAL